MEFRTEQFISYKVQYRSRSSIYVYGDISLYIYDCEAIVHPKPTECKSVLSGRKVKLIIDMSPNSRG